MVFMCAILKKNLLHYPFLTIAMDPDCGAWSDGREGGGGDGAGPEDDGGGSRLRQVQCDSVGLNGVSKVTKTRGAPYLQTITGNIPCSKISRVFFY